MSKCYFFNVGNPYNDAIHQVAITYTNDKHWYYRLFVNGEPTAKAKRVTLPEAITLSQKTEEEFRKMYGLHIKLVINVVRRETIRNRRD